MTVSEKDAFPLPALDLPPFFCACLPLDPVLCGCDAGKAGCVAAPEEMAPVRERVITERTRPSTALPGGSGPTLRRARGSMSPEVCAAMAALAA